MSMRLNPGSDVMSETAPPRLVIAAVEAIPIRIQLKRVYSGSRYRMTHRSTVVVRITTENGTVGEAYAGDEDTSLLEIVRIVFGRDHAGPDGYRRVRNRALLAACAPRDV